MTDLVVSFPNPILCKFPRIDRAYKIGIWSPRFCGLSSSLNGRSCRIQVQRVRRLAHSEVTRISAATCAFDRELRNVLELASDAELSEIAEILYGQSILSPLLKSITYSDSPQDALVQLGDQEVREALIDRLESRFLFLAADAKATLSGCRPSYRKVLLQVRKKLNVPCSTKLSTEDMEAEIFLHLLEEYSSKPKQQMQFSWKNKTSPINCVDDKYREPGQWQGYILAAAKLGAEELLSVILAGGSAMTITKLQHVVAKRLSGKMVLEAAKLQVAKEVMKKGGQAVATKLETQIALLAAEQGLAGAASRYIALRSMTMFLGPLLWGTFLADMVIRASGTDYARVVRAIYAFAQIRLTRTYGWTSSQRQLGNHVAEN